MKGKLSLLVLLCLITSSSGAQVCSVQKDGKAPCDVKGGVFSTDEVREISKKDATPFEKIYKTPDANKKIYLYLFYAYDCPHCKKAHEFIETLKKDYPELVVFQYEIKKNKANAKYFETVASEYGTKPQGVPTFFVGGKFFVGFSKDVTCAAVIREVKKLKGVEDNCPKNEIEVPMIGAINVDTISLPSFTIYIGFLDGLNPCAMWVLMFLLGLMVYAGSRKKIIFLGTTFVIASGIVYFLFMTAWVNIFLVIGYSKIITIVLGGIAVLMGIVNIKEIFFFKQGVSLMIPESVKPRLYAKSRKIINEGNKFFAVLGTIALAVFVNFIELGCTVGLPAIYTRVLSLRQLSPLDTYLYIALYNVIYVIPLAIIVAVFAYTMGHYKFTEKHGKIFKLISGLLMFLLGLLLIFYPNILVR